MAVPKKKRSSVRKLSPRALSARDEGPRLIPLDHVHDVPKLQHWRELADAALRIRRSPKSDRARGHSA